ncbi:MAG: 5-(carboxyamino)imidazole ribonucleotide mutase [Bacteroidetes bacterium]|nr:5-(carboxyamino)imidazole ribonucleotide mutase [Bacteroidota bacterium]
MEPRVSIIMGSTSDYKIMEATAKTLNDFKIPFEINALSAHRTPEKAEEFARNAAGRGIKVIIAAAGMAAHLPGVVAAFTTIPVIGVPINASFDGLDSVLSILQMPPGVPVATVAVNGAQNAAILAAQIIASGDPEVAGKVKEFKENLKIKIIQANEELKQVRFEYKTN